MKPNLGRGLGGFGGSLLQPKARGFAGKLGMPRLLKSDAQKGGASSWGESTFMQADAQPTVQGQCSWSKVTLQIVKAVVGGEISIAGRSFLKCHLFPPKCGG